MCDASSPLGISIQLFLGKTDDLSNNETGSLWQQFRLSTAEPRDLGSISDIKGEIILYSRHIFQYTGLYTVNYCILKCKGKLETEMNYLKPYI